MSLFEGDEVQLGCMLQGPHLGSEVFWYNNKNQVIRPDAQKYRLQQSGTWFKLTIRDTEWPSDSGTYRCAAVNAVGNTSLPISLHVKSKKSLGNIEPCPIAGARGTRDKSRLGAVGNRMR